MSPTASETECYRLRPGTAPLLVSMPHVGTSLAPGLAERMTPAGRLLADTDWHVDRLYDFLDGLDASVISAVQSRYVIDLNRPPDGAPLYPGASETGLCPITSFGQEPLYLGDAVPDAAEVSARRSRYWQPYHDRLRGELARLRARHERVVLWDAHSIRSRVPRFFEGRLPDLNFGTAEGASADPVLSGRLAETAAAERGYSHVVNGRFKGGYITRGYGDRSAGVHAVQLELSQITYMSEDPPFAFDEARAAVLRPLLCRLLEAAVDWAVEGSVADGRRAPVAAHEPIRTR